LEDELIFCKKIEKRDTSYDIIHLD